MAQGRRPQGRQRPLRGYSQHFLNPRGGQSTIQHRVAEGRRQGSQGIDFPDMTKYPCPKGHPLFLVVMVQKLGFHRGHIYIRGALGGASLARYAQRHHLIEFLMGQAMLTLSGPRQKFTERIGPSPGSVPLITGSHIRWTHRSSTNVRQFATIARATAFFCHTQQALGG